MVAWHFKPPREYERFVNFIYRSVYDVSRIYSNFLLYPSSYVHTELQNGFSQHVLFQAIAITTLPSRPLRDLPKLQYVRTVRRSLVLLYWRLQGHFSSRKNEYKRRQKERREMYLQDLSSQLVEILALGNAKKLRAEQEAYEQLLLREAREEAHRLEVQQQCLILDSSSRAAVTARRKMEAAPAE